MVGEMFETGRKKTNWKTNWNQTAQEATHPYTFIGPRNANNTNYIQKYKLLRKYKLVLQTKPNQTKPNYKPTYKPNQTKLAFSLYF